MVQTKKFSEFTSVNLTDDSNMLVGVGGGANIKAPKVVTWITSERPNPPIIGVIGYNTTILQYEYWDGLDWRQLAEGGDGTVSQINTGTGLTGGPITTVGSISFAEIAAESLWANTTGASAVPAVTALSTFLLSANNLSDVPNKSTARTNMGLAIGTNVQAWSAILDTVSAGTYIGDNSITTLGTVVFGTWNSVAIGAAYGGTGLTSTTAYGVITGGTTSTGNFQNVGTGTINQILSSQGNAALPAWGSLSALMDTVFGGVQGDIVYRNASAWTILAPGTSGQFLQTQGAAQNPIWAPGDGAGTVTSITAGTGLSGGVITSSGTIALISPVAVTLGGTGLTSTTINQILYSSASNTIVGLATVNSAGLLTNSSGVPGWVAYTGTGAPVLGTNPTITNPQIVTNILDANGNAIIGMSPVPSAVNSLIVQNSATGNPLLLFASGSDTNINLQIFGKGTGGVQVQGTGTNGNASVGYIGEFISSTVLAGSAVSATSGNPVNITSISLTAGDWDVCGVVDFLPAAGTIPTQLLTWISTTSATLPTRPNEGAFSQLASSGLTASTTQALVTGQIRLALAVTTTVYLSATSVFSVSTMGVYGFIGARRVR